MRAKHVRRRIGDLSETLGELNGHVSDELPEDDLAYLDAELEAVQEKVEELAHWAEQQ